MENSELLELWVDVAAWGAITICGLMGITLSIQRPFHRLIMHKLRNEIENRPLTLTDEQFEQRFKQVGEELEKLHGHEPTNYKK